VSEQEEKYRKQGFWPDKPISEYFEKTVVNTPGKIAVIDERFGSISYAQLGQQSHQLALALQQKGVSEGDRVVIALPNWRHISSLVLALNYIGAVGVHLPVIAGKHEFDSVINITEAKAIFVPENFRGTDYPAMIDSLVQQISQLEIRVVIDSHQSRAGWLTFDEFLSMAGGDIVKPDIKVSASDITSILFTSGSSGAPKGVMHSSNTFAAMNKCVASTYDFDSTTVIFMGVPLGFSGGFIHGVRLAFYLGATLVLQESWDPDRALEIMAKEKATFTMMTPTLLKDLMASKLFSDYAARLSLQLILCGGALVTPELLETARKALPQTLTTTIWGMTEGIGTACSFDIPPEQLLATHGKAFPGTELKVLDEQDIEVDVGETGELVMRGPQLFLGYYMRPELADEVFLAGGWFRTGDLASIDAARCIHIKGRRKALIIRGGVNISPEEVEEQLRGDVRIKEIAVVDFPDERLGERACACVVLNSGETDFGLDDLKEIAEENGLARHKWPEQLQIMENLPLTSSGKLKRDELRTLVRKSIAGSEVTGTVFK
jgi:cyclohexanecarboxylate-CoA ligase